MGKTKLCGAKTRAGTPCKRPAGWGTNHSGRGRCKLHGGCSAGPPKGSKNALKTGEHEAIWLDTLTDKERGLYNQVNTDNNKQLDEEIRLLSIRERRMLQRVQDVLDGWEEENIETKFDAQTNKKPITVYGDDGRVRVDFEIVREMVESERVEKKRAKLERVLAIEEALTRVQRQKSKLIELKHKIESDQGGENIKGINDQIAALADLINTPQERAMKDD